MQVSNSTTVLEGCKPDSIPASVFASTQPILLKGLVKDWELVEIAAQSDQRIIEHLKTLYGGQPAPIYFGKPGSDGYLSYNADVSALNFEIRRAPIDEMLDELLQALHDEDPPTRYIASNAIDVYFPELRKSNDLSFTGPYFEQHPLGKGDPLAGIWIGNRTTSPCHYDAQSNIACCVAGRRKVTLFPPDQIDNLYPGPLDLNPGGQAITMVDFAAPDFERFPRFREALKVGQVAELEPGDAVYIPCMWWHQVEALQPFNVLINYWWNTFPKVMGQAMTALEHALLSIRDRPQAEKDAWKHIFDYYIFGDVGHAGAHLPEPARGVLAPLDDTKARQLRAKLIRKLNR